MSDRSVQQTYIDATRDDRWWKYLVLPDYILRERVGYTLAEVAYGLSAACGRADQVAESSGHRLRDWASQ